MLKLGGRQAFEAMVKAITDRCIPCGECVVLDSKSSFSHGTRWESAGGGPSTGAPPSIWEPQHEFLTPTLGQALTELLQPFEK